MHSPDGVPHRLSLSGQDFTAFSSEVETGLRKENASK
jgi:hypothetical protein